MEPFKSLDGSCISDHGLLFHCTKYQIILHQKNCNCVVFFFFPSSVPVPYWFPKMDKQKYTYNLYLSPWPFSNCTISLLPNNPSRGTKLRSVPSCTGANGTRVMLAWIKLVVSDWLTIQLYIKHWKSHRKCCCCFIFIFLHKFLSMYLFCLPVFTSKSRNVIVTGVPSRGWYPKQYACFPAQCPDKWTMLIQASIPCWSYSSVVMLHNSDVIAFFFLNLLLPVWKGTN